MSRFFDFIKNELSEEEYEKELFIKQNPLMYIHFKPLDEMFDSKVHVKILTQDNDYFSTEFNIEKRNYIFHTKSYVNNSWGVIFFHNATNPFELIRRGINVGDVFSGVFESLKLFVKLYDVKIFYFSTEEEKLKKLYDSLQKYIENRTGYKLKETKEENKRKLWIYERGK